MGGLIKGGNLIGGKRLPVVRQFLELCLVDAFEEGIFRQEFGIGDDFAVIRTEDGSEVPADRAAPVGDIGLDDGEAGFMREEFFKELERRGMIEDLGVDPAAAAPG